MDERKKIAKFETVSDKEVLSSLKDVKQEVSIEDYHLLQLPRRATKESAGYDFFAPFTFSLKPHEMIKIPTGICCHMESGWVLAIFPRSGLGFKYRLQLNNTVGIIDKDYDCGENEGHIFIKLANDGYENKTIIIEKGTAFAQGVFLPFGFTVDDETLEIREGGFGSTDKVKNETRKSSN